MVSKEITITPDGKAVVTQTMNLDGSGQVYFRSLLGTCGPICGKAGHDDNDKPHVRNEACWNWKSEFLHLGEVRVLSVAFKPTTEYPL